MCEFVEQPRLPEARPAYHTNQLAVRIACLLQCSAQLLHLVIPADEACEPAGRSGLEPGAYGTRASQLEDFHRIR
jgi:hypothetical protein